MKMLLAAVVSALAAIMANRGIAVFNDGLRPIMPEHLEGRMSRAELAATSFAMSFGLVIGFGIPFSLTSTIILIHSILLGTDIIGSFSPDGNRGTIIAGVVGAVYGAGLVVGLEAIVNVFQKLPVNVMDNLGAVGTPIVAAFAVFPALATAYQFGVRKGIINLVLSILARQLTVLIGAISIGSATVTLNAEGMALIVGMLVLIFFAAREKGEEDGVDLASVFGERSGIKSNIIPLMVMGGLVAAATSYGIIAGDPILEPGSRGQLLMQASPLARVLGLSPHCLHRHATGVYGPVE